jgi:hypothetical protein
MPSREMGPPRLLLLASLRFKKQARRRPVDFGSDRCAMFNEKQAG